MQKQRQRKRRSWEIAEPEAGPSKPAAGPRVAGRPRWKVFALLGLALGAAVIVAMFAQIRAGRNQPPVLRCEVVASFPHAEEAFTQGLALDNGFFIEGTGGQGASSLRKVTPASGEVVQRVDLDARHFGEGIAVVGEEIYQLTWRSRVGFVYDKQTFQKLREFSYTGEGWGLAYDGRQLVMSDGTDLLRFFDPRTFRETRRVHVTAAGRRLDQLNELEFADGFLYANLWHKDYIVKISPKSGDVVAWIDLRGILPADQRRGAEAVLNGIAHDPGTGHFYVTGKNWPALFEVRFLEPTGAGK